VCAWVLSVPPFRGVHSSDPGWVMWVIDGHGGTSGAHEGHGGKRRAGTPDTEAGKSLANSPNSSLSSLPPSKQINKYLEIHHHPPSSSSPRTNNTHTRSVDLIRSFQQVVLIYTHLQSKLQNKHPNTNPQCSSSSSPSLSLPSWPPLLPRTLPTGTYSR
jgi:hypothetical protein